RQGGTLDLERLTLADIERAVTERAAALGLTIDFRQTNHEGELVDWVQEAGKAACGLILNAAAYSHTSLALLDALRTVGKPIIEVHLSNPYKRERYRRHSYVSIVAQGVICGFKDTGYLLAVDAMAKLIEAK
ncbi:MAG: 3-dehydroquinate dehydratase, partial [candidate division Zixibacteria bacterium]|nr:3-dehydroquinate dehydratase [candidate division Zixibacteria bacterium]